MEGKIKWYKKEKGYGFIVGDDGEDYFVHYTSLPEDMEDARESDEIAVTFDLKETDRKPAAVNVVFKEKTETSEEETTETSEE
jgi:CspA family cold shock protein